VDNAAGGGNILLRGVKHLWSTRSPAVSAFVVLPRATRDDCERGQQMDIIEYLEHRKRDCEERLRYVETTRSFRMFQVSEDESQVDITEQETQRLRQVRNGYQRAIEYLRRKFTT
jgi:hypothetical protein